LKILKSPYLNEKSSDFDEIWYTNAALELGDSHMTKHENEHSWGAQLPFISHKLVDAYVAKSVSWTTCCQSCSYLFSHRALNSSSSIKLYCSGTKAQVCVNNLPRIAVKVQYIFIAIFKFP